MEAEVLSEFKPTDVITPSESARIKAGDVATAPPKMVASVHKPGTGDVLSPLAGKVVSIEVKIRQGVTEGQRILTLEAMKMNTFVIAPRAGIMKEILVAPGQAVEEGVVLARLE